MSAYYASIFLLVVLIGFSLAGLLRGFVRTVAGLLCYVFAYVVANAFYAPISIFLQKLPFMQSLITSGIEMPAFDTSGGFFAKIGKMASYLFNNYMSSGSDAEVKTVLDNILADFLAKVFSFLVLFIVAVLVAKLLVLIIDHFCNIPVLKTLNKLLGLLVGFLCGLFITYILSNLYVNSLLATLNNTWPEVFVTESANTVLMKFFTHYSPVALILAMIDGIKELVITK